MRFLEVEYKNNVFTVVVDEEHRIQAATMWSDVLETELEVTYAARKLQQENKYFANKIDVEYFESVR